LGEASDKHEIDPIGSYHEASDFNWSQLRFIITKRHDANIGLKMFLLIFNQKQWVLLEKDNLVNFSDQSTLFLDKEDQETIERKDLMQKDKNLQNKF
jgi:hypothetical protein